MKKYSQLSLFSAGVSVAALLLASTAGFAGNYKGENYKGEAMVAPQPCPVEKSLKDGFYVGGQVGYDSYRINQDYASASLTGSNAMSATGWVGGVFAGYGQSFQETYYLGAEALVNFSGANQSNHDVVSGSLTNNSTFDVHTSYGARLLPGIKLNPSTMVYVPVGYLVTRAKGAQTGSFINAERSRNNMGSVVYGVGFETALCENFSLRGEYTRTNGASITSTNNAVKWKPSDNQFMLGLLYHFA